MPPSIFFDILQQTVAVSGIVRIFKMINFRFKLGFLSEPAHYKLILFFLGPSFFGQHATFLQLVFIDALQHLLERKRFASTEDSSGFPALCDIFRRIFLFAVGRKVVSEAY